MANWCQTYYTIVGNKEEITELFNLLKPMYDSRGQMDDGSSNNWLCHLVTKLGVNRKEVDCDGYISYLEELGDNGTKITLTTESKWADCHEVFDLIKTKYESIDYYYFAEEDSCGYFHTNDKEGLYYPNRFIVKQSYTDEKEFVNLEDALKEISKLIEKEVNSLEEAFTCIERYNEDIKDDYDLHVTFNQITVG